MKAKKPNGTLTQPYGANYNAYYKSVGLLGHTGEDYVQYHNAPIEATVTGLVYSIRGAKEYNTYTAVYILAKDDDGKYYEYSYGHLVPDPKIKEGDYVSQGTVIGYQSNYGICYSNGVLVTAEQKKKGSGAGSHLHYQKRAVEMSIKKGKHYLRNSKGALKVGIFYFNILNEDNGFEGCIDPKYDYKFEFTKTLKFGMMNNADVVELQKILKMPAEECTGNYLEKTRKAVLSFQRKNKVGSKLEIDFVNGKIVGSKTRAKLNSI